MKNSDILILETADLTDVQNQIQDVNIDCFDLETISKIKMAHMVIFQYVNGDIKILKSKYNIVKN